MCGTLWRVRSEPLCAPDVWAEEIVGRSVNILPDDFLSYSVNLALFPTPLAKVLTIAFANWLCANVSRRSSLPSRWRTRVEINQERRADVRPLVRHIRPIGPIFRVSAIFFCSSLNDA